MDPVIVADLWPMHECFLATPIKGKGAKQGNQQELPRKDEGGLRIRNVIVVTRQLENNLPECPG